MAFEPGNIVILKSGGLPMTVAQATDEGVQCMWVGEEGDLFRETLPEAVLELVPAIDPKDEEDESEGDEEDADEGEEEDDETAARKVA